MSPESLFQRRFGQVMTGTTFSMFAKDYPTLYAKVIIPCIEEAHRQGIEQAITVVWKPVTKTPPYGQDVLVKTASGNIFIARVEEFPFGPDSFWLAPSYLKLVDDVVAWSELPK